MVFSLKIASNSIETSVKGEISSKTRSLEANQPKIPKNITMYLIESSQFLSSYKIPHLNLPSICSINLNEPNKSPKSYTKMT